MYVPPTGNLYFKHQTKFLTAELLFWVFFHVGLVSRSSATPTLLTDGDTDVDSPASSISSHPERSVNVNLSGDLQLACQKLDQIFDT